MFTLPKIELLEYSFKRQQFLLEWLNSSILQNKLLDDIEEEYIPDGTITEEQLAKLKTLINPFDDNIQPGEIRLLSSAIVPDSQRPYYAAVIKQWEEDMVLIAPYSPFTVPATTGEFLTGREDFSLATLELWNARTVPIVLLNKSWLVDQLSETEQKEAFAVFANITSGKDLPEELRDRAGIPIVNPKDPRIEYQKEEAALLAPLQNRIQMYENFYQGITDSFSDIEKSAETLEFQLAADDNEASESKCIIFSGEAQEMMTETFIHSAEKHGEVLNLYKGDRFIPIDPDTKYTTEIQWQIPKKTDLKNGMILIAIDIKTKNIIGTGSVEEEGKEKFAAVKIHYPGIKRVISSINDIILTAVNIQ